MFVHINKNNNKRNCAGRHWVGSQHYFFLLASQNCMKTPRKGDSIFLVGKTPVLQLSNLFNHHFLSHPLPLTLCANISNISLPPPTNIGKQMKIVTIFHPPGISIGQTFISFSPTTSGLPSIQRWERGILLRNTFLT